MSTLRGPGAHEPFLIIEGVRNGLTFDQSVAEVEKRCAFTCETWWKDLNRKVITDQVAAEKAVAKKTKT